MNMQLNEAAQLFSIMLVDDQPGILLVLSEMVDDTGIAFVVAAESTSGAALESAQRLQPDLIMLDVSMPEMSGVEVAKRILARWPDARILAVSAHSSDIYVRSMFEAGVRGYMLKDKASTEVRSAIETIMKGGQWMGQGLMEIPA